jgi:hypothetical protein
MKQAALKDTTEILHKLESIEEEVMNLKLSVLKKALPSKGRIISLKGIIKRVDVTDKDISEAKKSLHDKTIE